MKRLDYRNLPPEILGAAGLNFAAPEDSSARQEMLGSHLSQALVIDGAEPRRCFTGMERRFGEATFSVKLPVNAEIKGLIEKYPRSEGPGGIKANPLTVALYESFDKRRLDVIELPHHHCKHNHFGFRYRPTANAARLRKGLALEAGTILADSPNVDKRGNYSIGTELNVAFMSIPGVLEDGMVIAESVIKKLTATGYEKRFGSWGHRRYPLNLYPGPNGEYRPHPEIGDKVRPDGLLFAFREYDELLAAVEMAEDQLKVVDHVFDRRVYAVPEATVVDVTARKGSSSGAQRTPETMNEQAIKYHARHKQFYADLTRTAHDLTRHGNIALAPRLHRLIVEGHVFTNELGKTRPKLMYNLQELDEWRVDITFEYKVKPSIGSKITDFHGGKGVICDIWPDEDMPTDRWGTRAELIRDGTSVIKRMNPGCLYEQYFNAQSDAMRRRLQAMKDQRPDTFVDDAWNLLLGYYQMVSPRMVAKLTSPKYKGSPKRHVEDVLKHGIYHWLPTVSPVTLLHAVQALRKAFPLAKGPVTYRGRSGRIVTTKRDIIIGSVYTMLLEKTGDEWSGVSSTKLNHFGLTSKINRHDKYANPARPMPVRILGESEVRLVAAACGGGPVAELVEMSNSPQLHKHIVKNLLHAAKPTHIDSVITDESLVGRGGRNVAFLHHSLETAGVRFTRAPANQDPPRIYAPTGDEPVL